MLLKPFAVLHMCANLKKSLFAPRAYAVPLCPKVEIVFVCSLRPLWFCYAPRAFAVYTYSATSKSLLLSCARLCSPDSSRKALQSLFALQPKKSHHILRDLIESLYGLRTFAVLRNQKRKSLCLSFATFKSSNSSRPLAVFICSSSDKSLHHITQPMQSR